MTINDAREFSVQCWCSPTTETITMDVRLAEEFAQLLKKRVDEAVESSHFMKAREHIAKVFQDDPSFRKVYTDNVAMLLCDSYGITDYKEHNNTANDIIKLIFES